MFLDYYGLSEQPFGVTPDPRFLYFSPTHREALASLFYGIESGRGFVALIAKPGMGKTTLLFKLLERLRQSARTAFLFQTQCDMRDLFRYLLVDLGIKPGETDLVRLHEQLNETLIREAHGGRRVVLVIDEAQNLEDAVLESVRLMSDFETPRDKLMQIVLAGQPQLADKLARPALSQLSQRVSVLARLEPFTPGETSRYIDYRLRRAGYKGGGVFKPDAERMLAARSEGIPRKINNLCFNALSLGYAQQQRRIDAAIVQEVVADLDLDSLGSEQCANQYQTRAPRATSYYQDTPRSAGSDVVSSDTWCSYAASSLSPRLTSAARRGDLWLRLIGAGVLAFFVCFFSVALFDRSSGSATSPSRNAPAKSVIVMVEPNQTLERISKQYLGRFDNGIVQEILRLNPQLTDPNHIEVGQRIELPLLPALPPENRKPRPESKSTTVVEGALRE